LASSRPEHNPSLYALSDHLDGALALGEDLLAHSVALRDDDPAAEPMDPGENLAEFVRTAEAMELAMTARVLMARKRAEEVKRSANPLKPLIALFVAGTAPLVDAAEELGDTTVRDFDAGDEAMAFLRGRGFVARDAAGLGTLDRLAVTEEYMVAGRIRLGTLLDLVATFLDTLDLLYDVYAEPAEVDGDDKPRGEATGTSVEPSPVA
jgi:hypothetical protein